MSDWSRAEYLMLESSERWIGDLENSRGNENERGTRDPKCVVVQEIEEKCTPNVPHNRLLKPGAVLV